MVNIMSLSVLRPYLTYNSATPNNVLSEKATFARLITYFGNFYFGFLSVRLRDFLFNIFHLQGKMGKMK